MTTDKEKEQEKPDNLQEEDTEHQPERTEKLKAKKKQPKEKELQEKIDELNDKYLRLFAEFDNYRKRVLKEKIEYNKLATADIIASLLTILDDFERALKFSENIDNVETIREGERLIFTKLKNILEQKGLQEMTSQGELFNTDLHEAITSIPAPSEDMKGKIIEETEKGYLLNGKVLRFAKVVVGN
jgi:molecular chaperone GrpE